VAAHVNRSVPGMEPILRHPMGQRPGCQYPILNSVAVRGPPSIGAIGPVEVISSIDDSISPCETADHRPIRISPTLGGCVVHPRKESRDEPSWRD
jgi:hypothetical protein